MGCFWNMPGKYDAGFDTCQADTGEVFVVSLLHDNYFFVNSMLV